MSNTTLSVIIVNWNTQQLLAQCLQSLYAAAAPAADRPHTSLVWFGAHPTEVVVVDNASSDGSVQMVRSQFPQVHLIENAENVGFARANNQALRMAQGKYLLLLNSDTVVHGGAFENLLSFMEAQPRAGATGPRLLNADGSLQPSCHPMLTPWREFWRLLFLERLADKATYPMEAWDTRTPRQVEVIKGASLLLRRQALEQVGVLDESYFMYTEEVDLCYRLARAGWQLWWVPEATVTHFGEASSRQVAEAMYVQLYRSKVQFYRKFGGKARADQFKWLVRLAYWPRLVVTTAGAPLSPSSAGRARTYRRLLRELRSM